jgi:hypothetical protein
MSFSKIMCTCKYNVAEPLTPFFLARLLTLKPIMMCRERPLMHVEVQVARKRIYGRRWHLKLNA